MHAHSYVSFRVLFTSRLHMNNILLLYSNPAAVVEGTRILFTSQIAKKLLRSCATRIDTCSSVDQYHPPYSVN